MGGALGLPLPVVGRTGAPGVPFAGVRKLPGYRLLGLCDLLGDIYGSAKAPRLLGVLTLSGRRLLGVFKSKGTCYLATHKQILENQTKEWTANLSMTSTRPHNVHQKFENSFKNM